MTGEVHAHRRAGRRQLRLGPALAALMLAASCASAPARSAPLPSPPPVYRITMEDYRFAHQDELPRGRVVFRVTNAGKQVHRLALIPLPEDVPPIAEQIRGSERRSVLSLAAIANQRPGARTAFAVDLAPGRYAFICFIVDKDGGSHARKGMASEFRAR